MTTSRIPLSILDLAPKSEGSSRKDALDAALDLAIVADRTGYRRYWMAEHHGSTAFMSSATSLLLTRAAEHTQRIRLGSGGVMLPNHTPLMVAEYYGTLAEIYGDRIDLGVGRAPGTDPITAAALRRGSAELDDFTGDIVELRRYFQSHEDGSATLSGAETAILGIPYHPVTKRQHVRAIPGEGNSVPVWILSSSPSGAKVAAQLGLPYSFASHFAPNAMEASLNTYRSQFNADNPMAEIDKPYVQAGVSVIVAPTQEEAELLATSTRMLKSDMRRGLPSQLREPSMEAAKKFPNLRLIDNSGSPSWEVVGTPDSAVEHLQSLVDFWDIDELIIVSWIWDPALRRRSYELLADAWF